MIVRHFYLKLALQKFWRSGFFRYGVNLSKRYEPDHRLVVLICV